MQDDAYADAAQLAALGHKAELHRNFSPLYLRFCPDYVPLHLLIAAQVYAWPRLCNIECTVSHSGLFTLLFDV